MSRYETLRRQLAAEPHRWLITGVAGFIGSHLLEALLGLDQHVVGLDDFSFGVKANLDEVRARVGEKRWGNFQFRERSVADLEMCRAACAHVDYVLHQAGFVSVPLSLENPLVCHTTNVTGTLNVLLAAREAEVRRVVYASSSAVYGDDARLPKIEAEIGRPLSPYGASKRMAEIYAQVFAGQFGVESVGLRYFNVFGARQNPTGGYAAVIPQWIGRMLRGEECVIHGSGGITRDFCPVADVVQANLLAATGELAAEAGRVFNVALGGSTTLDELHALLSKATASSAGRWRSRKRPCATARPAKATSSIPRPTSQPSARPSASSPAPASPERSTRRFAGYARARSSPDWPEMEARPFSFWIFEHKYRPQWRHIGICASGNQLPPFLTGARGRRIIAFDSAILPTSRTSDSTMKSSIRRFSFFALAVAVGASVFGLFWSAQVQARRRRRGREHHRPTAPRPHRRPGHDVLQRHHHLHQCSAHDQSTHLTGQ